MGSSTRNYVIAAIVLILVVAGGLYYWSVSNGNAGGIVWDNADEDMITLDLVKPGVTVLPKFTVTGQARGMWYFEATFPIEVLDKDGKRITASYAEAQADWMVEDFVPFRGTIDLGDYSGPATLILRRSNASGLPEHDASMSVPVEVFDVN